MLRHHDFQSIEFPCAQNRLNSDHLTLLKQLAGYVGSGGPTTSELLLLIRPMLIYVDDPPFSLQSKGKAIGNG